MLTDIRELTNTVKDRLQDLLEVNEIHPVQGRAYRCLNPEHNDSKPSMHLHPNGQYLHCFGCHATYDAIDVSAKINNLETRGVDFIDAVKRAAEDLDIKYQLDNVSAEDIKASNQFALYSKIASALTSFEIDRNAYTDEIRQYVQAKDWKASVLAEMGIGCLTSAGIATLGDLTPSDVDRDTYLRENGILKTNSPIFDINRLIFTFHDSRGRPVGFAARDIAWTEESQHGKYVNTSGTLVSIFQKGGLLYNYHRAVAEIRSRSKERLFIFEGQGDVVTAYHNGIKNCVGLCTNAVTADQVHLIKRSGATRIVLALDGNEAGQAGMQKFLMDNLGAFQGIRLFVKTLPKEHDPDSFIREQTVEKFHALTEQPAFDWLLARLKSQKMESDQIAKQLVTLIATIPSPIEREGLIRKLSLETELSSTTLLEEVYAIVHAKDNNNKHKLREIAEDTFFEMKKHPEAALNILDQARSRIQALDQETAIESISGDYFASQILSFKEENEAHMEAFPGFTMPLMPNYAEAFNNDWSKGTMICLGGDENCGKTSFSCFLSYNLLMGAENNTRVFFMTIDDSVQELYRKFITIAAAHKTGFKLEINHVVRPTYWADRLSKVDPQYAERMLNAYNVGYQTILQLARQDRLIISGVPISKNLRDFKRSVQKLRKKYPDDNIFAYLDNIHKLPMENADARLAFKETSNDLKNLAVEEGVAIGGTLEYNSDQTKRGKEGRPTNNSLAESRAFRYDASALVHMYNNLHVMGNESVYYHTYQPEWSPVSVKYPVVEAIIGKNKISGDKSSHMFKFYPGSSWFEYVPYIEAIKEAMAKDKGTSTEGWGIKKEKEEEIDD